MSFSLNPSDVKQLSKNSFKDLVALLTEVLPDGGLNCWTRLITKSCDSYNLRLQ